MIPQGVLCKRKVENNMFLKKNFFWFLIITIFFSFESNSKGDLAIRSKKIELKLGSKSSDYEMSLKTINLETGKSYRLEISSMGFKEYEFEA